MSIATVPKSSDNSAKLDFEQIFRQYSPMIYRTAYAVTGSHHDADDVLQRIFLKLIQREYPPDLKQNPKAYLHRAAVNMSLDVIRARRRYSPADEIDGLESGASPWRTALEDELHLRLHAVLADLDPDAVHILVLRYVHDYSDAEISKMLGKSRGAIALRLFRLRARLKKLLRQPPEAKR